MVGKTKLLLAGMIVSGLAVMSGGVSPVVAQDVFHDPVLGSNLSAPATFDGLYAGVSFGLMNSNKKVFYPNENGYRVPAGVFAGYNAQLTPWMVAGVEAQLEGAYEWQDQTLGYNAFALGRLGLLTAEDFAVYEMAGLGLIDGRGAYALGVGVEQKVTDRFSMRAEALSFGQFNPPSDVTDYGGVMGMKIMLGGLWYLSDGTRSLAEASSFETTKTRFTGPYLGLYAGGGYNPQHNFFGGDNDFYGWHITRFVQGGIAGWNYEVAPMVRAGGEIQAGLNYNTSGQVGTEVQALARVGLVPFDGLMVYGSGGVGAIDTVPAYSLGGGVEYALWGKNTLRFDVHALGEIDPGPPFNATGFSAVKFAFGTLWHLD